MLIDTHAHINMPQYTDLAEVLARAKASGLKYIIDVGVDPESIERSVALAKKVDEIYSVIGVHPHDAPAVDEKMIKRLRELLGDAAQHKIVGIGETGLDYFKNYSPKETQIEAFKTQIRLANEFKMPLAVHSRQSEDEAITILRETADPDLKVVFHCYAGNVEQAQKILDLGYFISVTGIVTFPKAENIREVVKMLPLDRMMLETDCPYLAPAPNRGKRNEPANVSFIAEKIAEILGISVDEIASKTTQNACQFFNLP